MGTMRTETLMCMFPSGYNPGDIWKDIVGQVTEEALATGLGGADGDGWFNEWYPIDEDRYNSRFHQCMTDSDPLWYQDCSYKDFFGEGDRDALFEAINSG